MRGLRPRIYDDKSGRVAAHCRRILLVIAVGLFIAVPQAHAEPEEWEKTILELHQKHASQLTRETPPPGTLDKLPNEITKYGSNPPLSELSREGLENYIQIRFGSHMSDEQKKQAADNLERAIAMGFNPYASYRHLMGRTEEKDLNVLDGEHFNPDAKFPEIAGLKPPYFQLGENRHAGNNAIKLVMDAQGKLFVVKKASYIQDSNLTWETKVLEKAQSQGHPNFVKSLGTGNYVWAYRELLDVECNLYKLNDSLVKAALQSKEGKEDLRRFHAAFFGFADSLTEHGLGFSSPDFGLSEVLIVREGEHLRLKLTDLEHGAISAPGDRQMYKRNRDIIFRLLSRQYGAREQAIHLLSNLRSAYSQYGEGSGCFRSFTVLNLTRQRYRKPQIQTLGLSPAP